MLLHALRYSDVAVTVTLRYSDTTVTRYSTFSDCNSHCNSLQYTFTVTHVVTVTVQLQCGGIHRHRAHRQRKCDQQRAVRSDVHSMAGVVRRDPKVQDGGSEARSGEGLPEALEDGPRQTGRIRQAVARLEPIEDAHV